MTENYQKKNASRATSDELALPDSVCVAMADIAGSVNDGLLAFAVVAGLQVMAAMMDESVTAVAGPKGRHQPERTAVRHGSEAGSVVLGGRRVPVRRPRVRACDGSGELAVEAYDVFSNSDLLGDIALERMMAKLSTRRFVARTETALAELMATDLSGFDVVALMLDGVHFAGHCCVVVLRKALNEHAAGTVTPTCETTTEAA